MKQLQNYFFSHTIPVDSLPVKIGLIASALLFILGCVAPLISGLLQKRYKTMNVTLVRSLALIARLSGLGWFLLFGLRFEGIVIFMVRLWVYLLLIPVIVALVMVIRRHWRALPTQVQEAVIEDRYKKYLPKPRT